MRQERRSVAETLPGVRMATDSDYNFPKLYKFCRFFRPLGSFPYDGELNHARSKEHQDHRTPHDCVARCLREQHATTNANRRVIDVVKLGRFPHRSMFSGSTRADDQVVEEALVRTDMIGKCNESRQSLFRGERTRTHIARALAQSPKELILEQPTNHLDIQHHRIARP
ncbi:hypothetical protein ATU3C_25345 [Agrobacterium genomosp. 3 str. RTP8]|nr:hypothetical protein [Agrobacterium tomkonis RTP8]